MTIAPEPDPLFAVLDGTDDDPAVVAAASAIAQANGASVDAVFLGRDPASALFMGGDGFTGGLGVSALDALERDREAAVERARAIAQSAPDVQFRVFDGPRARAASLARLCAFAVMGGQGVQSTGVLADIAGDLLIDGGVAVLVARSTPPFTRLGLAWDGSREAARALRSARSIVRAAGEVVVMQAPDDVGRRNVDLADPQLVDAWLTRRGVRVAHQALPAGPVSETLLEACAEAQVDLLIAGAYGHARLREAVFGGVTRRLLDAASGPSLFLAH